MAITIGTNGWCTLAAVKNRVAHLSAVITAGTGAVTEAITETFITSRFHEINGYVRQSGYTVAGVLADSAALAQVALANELMAAADVMDALNAGVKGARHPLAETYERQYERMLETIGQTKVDLGALDSGQEAAPAIPTSHRSGGDYRTKPTTIDEVW